VIGPRGAGAARRLVHEGAGRDFDEVTVPLVAEESATSLVLGTKQIEITVVVVIAPGRHTPTVQRQHRARGAGPVGERPVAIVDQEALGADPPGEVEIEVAVVVEVAEGSAAPGPRRGLTNRSLISVKNRTTVVAIDPDVTGRHVHARKHVHVAVVIEVNPLGREVVRDRVNRGVGQDGERVVAVVAEVEVAQPVDNRIQQPSPSKSAHDTPEPRT